MSGVGPVLGGLCAALAVLVATAPGAADRRLAALTRPSGAGPGERGLAPRPRPGPLLEEVPAVLDLICACLAGGSSLVGAAAVVATALPGPCADRLNIVITALDTGISPGEAWRRLAPEEDDPLAAAARVLAAAAESGAPTAAVVGRLAAEARAGARAASTAAARRVGVLVVAPLALCFLPAFLLLGVVPVVAGLLAPLVAAS